MSSTNTGLPVAAAPKPAPNNSAIFTLPTWVLGWEKLIVAHERLLIVAILAITGWHFYSKGVDAWVSHESGKAQQAAVVVKTDDAATKAMQAQLTALQATVATQTAIIAKQIATRNQVTVAQQATDKTLPPAELAQRWQTLLHIANGIDPVTGQQFTVTQDAAVQTVVSLEEVPTLTANVASLQTELNNDTTIINKQQELISDQAKELVDEKKSHVADVNEEKAKTKKAFVRGLKVGAVVGFIGGLFVGHGIAGL